jgi:hypothetical protein
MRPTAKSYPTAASTETKSAALGRDRREHRRHDMEQQDIAVDRWDGHASKVETLGKIMDISAGGVRFRTRNANVRPDQQIRVRLELPAYAGISPFIAPTSKGLQPRADWVGWIAVSRVSTINGEQTEVAGRLVDMDELDRGMLGLYLSTQPIAA